MKRVNVWTVLSLLMLAALSTACATVSSSSAVTPEVLDYSRQFQAKAAEEMERLGPPCAHDVVIDGCSAVVRLVIDYKETRDKIRAIRG